MSESMRGSRLGAQSWENDAHVAPAPSLGIRYTCPEGHESVMRFSVEAEEIPYEWTCRCGQTAIRRDVPAPEAKPERHVRTHWDMLLERRTISELEDLLNERLELLHAHEREFRKSA